MPGVFSRNSLEHAVAGSVGTVLSSLLVFPLERLKTLVHVKGTESLESGCAEVTLRDVFLRILRNEGVRGLYYGCIPTMQTVGASNFLYFFLFEGLKEPLAVAVGRTEGVGAYATLAASALAGALNMTVTEPLWRACVVLQAQSSNGPYCGQAMKDYSPDGKCAFVPTPQSSIFGAVRDMWVSEGPKALWRGLPSSLWLVSNPVIQFFAYDLCKAFLQHSADGVSSLEAFFMGAFAKALATIATFPLQVAQSRLRALRNHPGELRRGDMVTCLLALWREKGIGGMYLGLAPKLLQTVTQAAFMFAFYEKVHWLIRRLSRRGVSGLAKRALGGGIKASY